MRDPFPPARIAGVLALAATQQYFLLNEVANRVLPALCSLTVDPEKTVREPAFKTIRGFLGKLEKVSEDPSLRETMGKSHGVMVSWRHLTNNLNVCSGEYFRGRCSHGYTVDWQCGSHLGRLGGDCGNCQILSQSKRLLETSATTDRSKSLQTGISG